MSILIRTEEPKDQEAVYDLVEEAFDSELEANLLRLFDANNSSAFSLVAEKSSQVVGQILLSKMTDDIESNLKIYALGPMAVDPDFQNSGIGTKLVNKAIEKAVKSGVDAIFVLGHDSYYPKFGFVSTAEYDIACEYDVPAEVFMVKDLTGQLSILKGETVRYANEFKEVF